MLGFKVWWDVFHYNGFYMKIWMHLGLYSFTILVKFLSFPRSFSNYWNSETQLQTGYIVWFNQSEVMLLSNASRYLKKKKFKEHDK